MAKSKNQVIQGNNNWERNMITTTRDLTVTNHDSLDLSHSDEFVIHPFRSVNISNPSHGPFEFDKFAPSRKLDPIHVVQ